MKVTTTTFDDFASAKRWADELGRSLDHVTLIEATTIASWETPTHACDLIEYVSDYKAFDLVGSRHPIHVLTRSWEVVVSDERDDDDAWIGGAHRLDREFGKEADARRYFDALKAQHS